MKMLTPDTWLLIPETSLPPPQKKIPRTSNEIRGIFLRVLEITFRCRTEQQGYLQHREREQRFHRAAK